MRLPNTLAACAAYLNLAAAIPSHSQQRHSHLRRQDAEGLLSIVLGTGVAGPAPTSCDMQPQNEYTTTTPDAVGLDDTKLQEALDYAALDGSSSIKVFRNGCLAGQGFRESTSDRVPELNAGQTKAVVALVAGIVSDRGWVDLDAPIAQYLPADLRNYTRHAAVSLRTFMQLASGVQVNHVEGLNFFLDISRTREYFAAPFEHKPGTYYEFDEITPSVVVYVLERQIKAHMGQDVDFQAFAQCELFDALGIPTSAYFWQKDKSGTTTGYSSLWLRPLEYARFGLLLINNGKFGGHQIISPGYVRQLRQGSNANCGFGLYVWLNSCKPGQTQVNTDYPSRQVLPGVPWIESAPSDMYYSLGLGTFTYVIPSLNMIVSRAGYQELDTVPGAVNGDLHGAFPGNAGGPGDHEFFRKLMSAVNNIPASVQATIKNSGPYNRPPDESVNVTKFLLPLNAPLGSYTALGRQGPVGCNAISCQESPNNGLNWIGEIPRVIPGLIGLEQRPSGASSRCDATPKIFPLNL